MPANEETYRSQTTLHVVFAISSIAMTLAIVWMIMADHLRPWKQVQREFHAIEHEKLEESKTEKLAEQKTKNQSSITEVEAKIAAAEQLAIDNSRAIRQKESELKKLDGAMVRLDTEKKFQKAELDSQRSLYDGMIDRGEEREARRYTDSVIVASEVKLGELTRKYELAAASLGSARKEINGLKGNIDDLRKEKDRLTREADRVERVIVQKDKQYYGIGALIRGLPGLDLAAPPTKIQQISLPELTINYNFKDVPRYDRCMTCHQGIDRIGYDKAPGGQPMKSVYAAHPFLTTGAITIDPSGKEVEAGLYVDSNGPHGLNRIGCTICHGGNGSGTDFTYSSHEPNDPHEKHEWEKEYSWREMHHWDEPMLPTRFLESSCIKCHHQVTDVPQATKLQAGFERIVKFGCTGCHTIGGEGSFGPDLTDERQVGPNLKHIGSKVSKEWTAKWIKNPHAFRPDTRMPRFYDVTNNNKEADQPKVAAEVHSMAHYLFAKSTPPVEFVEPPAKESGTDKGKELFLQKGCLACHAHKETAPESFPESVREFAKANFGPNLSNISAKFASKENGQKWLANWIKAPEAYHAKSLMPNLQLSWQDSVDIAAWILTIPGEWPKEVKLAGENDPETKKGLDELTRLYKSKLVSLSELDGAVAAMTHDEKLLFVGEKTIGRLGCFGCHNIAGFESYKPIGTPLNAWGAKSPTKLDYGHITEYLSDQKLSDDETRDGTDEYYQEKLVEHTRSGFLYQKLHRPRSYDYKKTDEDLKAWDERLRMPQFTFADDPKAVEEVMTFVLGLTGEKIAAKYLPKSYSTPAKFAVADGAKLLNRHNCTGCHVLEMPKFSLAKGTNFEEVFTDFATNVKVSYNARASDYLSTFYPKLKYDPKAEPVVAEYSGEAITIEGMPIGQFEDDLTVQLWKQVTIRGHTFNPSDTLTLNAKNVIKVPAVGGDFAWLYATMVAEQSGGDFGALWNRLPPPLLREGKKVQTPWLTAFFKDPYVVRPATNLRMPKFHLGKDDKYPAEIEAAGLANYFAAKDRAEFPYQSIPEREQGYLAKQESDHPGYLNGGWSLMTKGACIQCHAIGQYMPTGGAAVVNGPNLRQVANRFRPEYLAEWLANPKRLIPYTAMPQNVIPSGPEAPGAPKSMTAQPLVQVKAIRDTLLNYVQTIESQMAAGVAKAEPTATPKPPEAPKTPGAGAGGDGGDGGDR